MRTTIDLPDALARRAKIAAVHRRLPLRELIARALEHELAPGVLPGHRPLSELPVIRSRQPGTYELKPADLQELLLREECAAYEAAQRR